jgi:23S rRNA pseudouridine2605 synthase
MLYCFKGRDIMFERIDALFKRHQGHKDKKQHDIVVSETGYTYLVLNKPKAVPFQKVTGYDITVNHLLPKVSDLQPLGFNDDTTEGLVVFTNDRSLLDSKQICEFVVKVDKTITSTLYKQLSRGITIKMQKIELFNVEKIDNKHLRFELLEEMENEVSLIFESLGYHAIRVMKVRINDITINNLKRKKWRHLSLEEINKLKGEKNE